MNNIKKMILGFAAVASIVVGSAFTNAINKSRATTFLVQVSPGVWEQRNSEPGATDCEGSQVRQCYYQVNDESILTQESYSPTDIDNFANANKIDDGDHSAPALYTGP